MVLYFVTEKSELEIEAIKVKGQFEEAFVRFPHIAEQIFEILDVQSLSKCQEVSQHWQSFIFETKPISRQLVNYTSIRRSKLKKSLKDYDFQTIQILGYCSSFSHKQLLRHASHFKILPHLNLRDQPFCYYLLSEGKLDETQYLLAKLMLCEQNGQINYQFILL